MSPVRSISLTAEQLAYIQTKGNVSAYLRQLIDRDMTGGQAVQRDDLEATVRRVLREMGATAPAIPIDAQTADEDLESRATAALDAILGRP
jgi:hypothetical protein